MIAYVNTIPFITCCAILGWISLVLLVLPSVRRFVDAHYSAPAPSSGVHFPLLDSLRGLAALFVASFHTWQWLRPYNDSAQLLFPFIENGDKGVPIFAGLSGFLIFSVLKPKFSSLIDLRNYLIRRFLRIYPLFVVTVLAATALGQMRHDPSLLHGLVSELLMFQVLGFPYRVVLPSWTIHVEVAFYGVLPLLLLATEKHFLRYVAAILLASLFVGHSGSRVFQLVPFFCVGILSAFWAMQSGSMSPRPWLSTTTAILGMLLLLVDIAGKHPISIGLTAAAALFQTSLPLPDVRSVDLCLGLGLLLTGLATSPKIPILTSAPLRFIGTISYSIYLGHTILLTVDRPELVIDGFGKLTIKGTLASEGSSFAFFFLYLPAIIFWSALSYLLVERPFLRLRPRTLKQPSLDSH